MGLPSRSPAKLLWKLVRLRWLLNPLRTTLLDLRYGSYLGTEYPSRFAQQGAHAVQSIAYRVLEKTFSKIPVRESDVLVDVGCGYGRVFNWWLSRGWKNRMVGLEIDPVVAEATRLRLRAHRNVEIFTGDAMEMLPKDATIFFLNNPFNEAIMLSFRDVLLRQFAERGNVTIGYWNCLFLGVFEGDPNWEIIPVEEDDPSYDPIAVIRMRGCPGEICKTER